MISRNPIRKSLEIFEKLTGSDPTSAVYLRNFGYCYEKPATAKERLASDGKMTALSRTKQWNEARNRFQKASEVFLNLKNQGTVIPADTEKIERFSAKMIECENVVTQMSKSVR